MSAPKPSWFRSDAVMVSTAPTCGLARGGRPLAKVSPTGSRITVTDPETGARVDAIDDRLLEDMIALQKQGKTETLRFVPAKKVSLRAAVPVYYDGRFDTAFDRAMRDPRFGDFDAVSLGDLMRQDRLAIRGGHGSPSTDQRVGDVPYIKVSDLRAGLVNINPTNRVPREIAEQFWRGSESGLKAFDILSPERTSKNIGDFCVLMPGQEQVLLTKEIIVLRPGHSAQFDAFYLLWAMTLKVVRHQWRRIVFMQTNREDVGKRYLEIRIPVARNRRVADRASSAFRDYFTAVAHARTQLAKYLDERQDHHFFVSGAESPEAGADP